MNTVKLTYIAVLVTLYSCGIKDKKAEEGNQEQVTQALMKEADSLYQEDIYFEAVDLYTKLINIEPNNGEFYYRRAHSYAHLTEPKFVPEDYLQAATLGYRKYESYYSLGVIYSTVTLNDSLAIMYFKKALVENPESEEVRLMLENLGVEDAKRI